MSAYLRVRSLAGDTLKVISTHSVGHGRLDHHQYLENATSKFADSFRTDHIDTKALQNRNVRLGYTPDVLNDAGQSAAHLSKAPPG